LRAASAAVAPTAKISTAETAATTPFVITELLRSITVRTIHIVGLDERG